MTSIACGNLIKDEIENNLKGKRVKEYRDIMNEGKNCPDKFVNAVMKKRLEMYDVERLGLCLNGYPRNEAQYKFMKEEIGMEPDVVIIIDYSDDKITTSYMSQRFDPNTGRVYSARSMKAIKSPSVSNRLKELPDGPDKKIKRR
jgi:adenylate kinase family enzyme